MNRLQNLTAAGQPIRLSEVSRRFGLLTLFLLHAVSFFWASAVAGSAKKGIGLSKCTTQEEAMSRVAQLNPTWYYNWSAYPSIPVQASPEFVPMIWGLRKNLDEHLAAVEWCSQEDWQSGPGARTRPMDARFSPAGRGK
jgi:hypothetical protein